MKKSILNFVTVFALSGALLTSCSSNDDNGKKPTSSFTADPANFQGKITDGEVILDATKTYKLTGGIRVENGATLTIPAGTVIEGTGGTASYIAVAQGGKINVNGTAAKPVVMTATTKAAGKWGGLVICGKAPINRDNGKTTTATSEVAELTYGGTIANDNSGSIKYLRIEYAGAAFNTEKEFNGLSFFGVGSGTVVENVQAYYGADDGFEFFGGTVNTKNLISIGNEDDQFDWTEGWSGTNENWYGKLDFGKGNRGIEADNFEFGYAFAPISNPTITNLTLVGPGSTAAVANFAENQAIKLRRGTKAKISNVVVTAWATGVDVENDETIAFVGTDLKVSSILFLADVPTKTKGKKTDGTSASVTGVITESTGATGAGNGIAQPTWAAGWSVGF